MTSVRMSHFVETSSVEHAGLVCRDHVLDVDEGIGSAVALECAQGLLDKVSYVFALLLGVVDRISSVRVCVLNSCLKSLLTSYSCLE